MVPRAVEPSTNFTNDDILPIGVPDQVAQEEDKPIIPLDDVKPVADTPAPAEDSPAPVEDTPAPVEDTPAPVEDTPVPVEDTPVETKEPVSIDPILPETL